MAGVNKVILVGNLGKDPEVRHLENGSVVANMTLATTESYKDRSGNRVDNTEWHDLELWDAQAKIAEQYLRKGSQIYVEGKIKTESWQDEQGNNRKKTRIRVNSFTMLGSRPSGSDSDAGSTPAAAMEKRPIPAVPDTGMDDEMDDLPF